jgi:hypothetical protein
MAPPTVWLTPPSSWAPPGIAVVNAMAPVSANSGNRKRVDIVIPFSLAVPGRNDTRRSFLPHEGQWLLDPK